MLNIFTTKNVEYGAVEDVFHNFNMGKNTMVRPSIPEDALWGMANKHLVAVIDIIWKLNRGIITPQDVVDEKVGDLTLYLWLLRGMLYERNQLKESEKHGKQHIYPTGTRPDEQSQSS